MASGTGAPGDPRRYVFDSSSISGTINLGKILKSVGADPTVTTPIDNNHVEATGDDLEIHFVAALSAPELSALDSLVASVLSDEPLESAKSEKLRAIDNKTDAIIDLGFEFPPSSGVMFSLSHSAQMKMLGADTTRNDQSFNYPVIWNSIDDTATVTLSNANDIHNFYLSGLGAVRDALDSGTTLKDQVRAATTVAEVDAIVDNR